ncbi:MULTISPECIES: hypothetical protein [Aerosakkonema]|uniref:hypothetical protein n=1 Tax=Aerosakkonema TaxID=1246629 RepID=UPI0035B83B2D
MNLSYKATQFIIEAIEFQMKAYKERLAVIEDVDEDEASEIGNDYYFLEALRKDLVKSLDKWGAPKALQSNRKIPDRTVENGTQTTMQVPTELVPIVRELIAKHQDVVNSVNP